MAKITKADRIRQLAKQKKPKLTTGEIAEVVAKEFGDCSITYARVYSRQRINGCSRFDRQNYNRFKAKHGACPSTVWRRKRESNHTSLQGQMR